MNGDLAIELRDARRTGFQIREMGDESEPVKLNNPTIRETLKSQLKLNDSSMNLNILRLKY